MSDPSYGAVYGAVMAHRNPAMGGLRHKGPSRPHFMAHHPDLLADLWRILWRNRRST